MDAGIFAAYAVIYILIFAVGAVIASFLNVVIYRLPKKLSFISDRSHCVSCGAVLGPLDMVPVFSYIFLGGKCRRCGAPFSPRYAIVEALGGALSVLAYAKFGLSPLMPAVCALLAGLILAAFIDIDTMTIPNGVIIYMIIPAAALVFLLPDADLLSHLIGLLCVSLPLLLITLIIPGSFGGGDIKLFAVCGLALGWKLTLFAGFVSLLTGAVWGIYLLAAKKLKPKQHMVFGPFISLGVTAAVFIGNNIISWYLGLF